MLHAVRAWREEEGVPVFFTIDAGPNVHLICEEDRHLFGGDVPIIGPISGNRG